MGLKDIALGHSKSQLRSAQPSPSVQKHTVYQTEFNANAMIGDKELHPCAPYSQYPEMTSIFSPAPRTLDDSDNLQIGATLKVFFLGAGPKTKVISESLGHMEDIWVMMLGQ